MVQPFTKQTVCMLGLGHVGLPLACTIAKAGYSVTGVDTNPKRLANIASGSVSIREPGLDPLLRRVLKEKTLILKDKPEPADIVILAVPTLLKGDHTPDLSYLEQAVKQILSYLEKRPLVLIESTCPIGTTEQIAEQLHKGYPNPQVAYCPERVFPGKILQELVENDRVVGGIDSPSTKRALAFYRSFVQGKVTGCHARTAEAVKLAENGFRDLNIAYANEWSIVAHHLGLDVEEIIALANRHPRCSMLKPGAGVGGHCIAIDPWYLITANPELTPLTRTAREVNLRKVEWIVERVTEVVKRHPEPKLACLGVAYKANSSTLERSPALAIVEKLEKIAEVKKIDPLVGGSEQLEEGLQWATIVVGLVPHTPFKSIAKSKLAGKTLLDFAAVL